jgi:hypothetical protein
LIDKNLLFQRCNDTERLLVCQGNYVTTCCGGRRFDSGRADKDSGHKLKRGNAVTFVGFGTFGVSKRKAREGRNPQTGAVIKIAAKKVPVFKAGKGLTDAVK